jgi:hypothetical protein
MRRLRVLRDDRTKERERSKAFFSEEKKQKTFNLWIRAHRQLALKEQKFFGSFFQKRTFLPSFLNQGETP